MRKTMVIALAAAALSLASCSGFLGAVQTVTGFSVNQEQISRAEAGYVAVQKFFVAYRCLYDNVPADPKACLDGSGKKIVSNPCRAGSAATITNLCAERAVVVRLQEADKVVGDALDRVQADLRTCQSAPDAVKPGLPACTGLGAAYSTLTTAITAATALARQFGFKG